MQLSLFVVGTWDNGILWVIIAAHTRLCITVNYIIEDKMPYYTNILLSWLENRKRL